MEKHNENHKLYFSITGEGYENIIKQLFNNGAYASIYKMLDDDLSEAFIANKITIQEFAYDLLFNNAYTFKGLNTLEIRKQPHSHNKEALIICYEIIKHYIDAYFSLDASINFDDFRKLIGKEKADEIIFDTIIKISTNESSDGYVLKNGKLLYLGLRGHHGFDKFLEHIELKYYIKDAIKFSSGSFVIHSLNEDLNESQYNAVMYLYRKRLASYVYAEGNAMQWLVSQSIKLNNHGKKYGILKFFKDVDWFNIPEFKPCHNIDREYRVFEDNLKPFLNDSIEQIIVRTSPEISFPGMLSSIVTRNKYYFVYGEKDRIEFQHHIKKLKGNIYTFVQEYIDGKRCVINCINHSVNYSIEIPEPYKEVIESMILKLNVCTNNGNYQVELILEDKVYFVQFRFLTNLPKNNSYSVQTDIKGFSFSSGKGTFDISEILIVKDDNTLADLRNYKALIIQESPVFAHLLALSTTLKIPSCYGVNIDLLKDKQQIYIDTSCENSIINIIK